MSLDALKQSLPDYAKDIKLNLSSLATEEILSPVQRAGAFIVSAIASRNPQVTQAILAEFGPQMTPEALNGAKAAAAIMAMNNIYYRFTHLTQNEEYGKLPARLRMNVMANPGVPKADFELWSLAVSAINGCGMCIDSHDKVVRAHGISAEQVQAAVRIASTVHAAATVMDTELANTMVGLNAAA